MLAALLLSGCNNEPAEVIQFVQPNTVTVREGDSLESIARKEGVPIDELMGWNGLGPADQIWVGMRLLVFDFPEQEEVLASLEAGELSTTGEIVPAEGKPAPPPRPKKPRKAPTGPVLRVEASVVAAEAPPPPPDEEVATTVTKGRKIVIDGARVDDANVLAAIEGLDEGDADALARAAANMERRSGTDRGSGLSNRRNLSGGGGEAETMDHVADTKVLGKEQGGPHGNLEGIRVPKMSKAPAKRCLKGPSEADLKSDQGYVMAKGLDQNQVRAGMSRVIRASISCIPRGTTGEFTVTVEVTVGCNGLVDNVWLANSGGMPRPVTACIEHTVGYASFAAHALPDGAVFQYPITYRF